MSKELQRIRDLYAGSPSESEQPTDLEGIGELYAGGSAADSGRTPPEVESPDKKYERFMRQTGTKVKNRQDILGYGKGEWIVAGILGVIILVTWAACSYESDEDKQARLERERARAEEKAAESAEERQKGFHCLSKWDGRHTDFAADVKRNLNNPASFDHVETRVSPVSHDGSHAIYMTYRATNAFGAVVTATAKGSYLNRGCSHTVDAYQ